MQYGVNTLDHQAEQRHGPVVGAEQNQNYFFLTSQDEETKDDDFNQAQRMEDTDFYGDGGGSSAVASAPASASAQSDHFSSSNGAILHDGGGAPDREAPKEENPSASLTSQRNMKLGLCFVVGAMIVYVVIQVVKSRNHRSANEATRTPVQHAAPSTDASPGWRNSQLALTSDTSML
jgi:hypothetical protein